MSELKYETNAPKKHVFIATPAYDGCVHVPYALSLVDTQVALMSNNIKVTNRISTSGSLLVAERNRLIEQFWLSDATHILFVDSDLGWPAQAVLAMLDQDKEFVCGVYPARLKQGRTKTEYTFRPVLTEDSKIVNEKHLLKMEYVPSGFMLISRSAIKKMRDAYPELYYSPKNPLNQTESTYCLFNTEVWEGEFWGEDYVFCRRARDAGVEIWADPLIQFDHAGTVGMLIEHLHSENEKAKESQEN